MLGLAIQSPSQQEKQSKGRKSLTSPNVFKALKNNSPYHVENQNLHPNKPVDENIINEATDMKSEEPVTIANIDDIFEIGLSPLQMNKRR